VRIAIKKNTYDAFPKWLLGIEDVERDFEIARDAACALDVGR
jgi:hypothetical protein